MKHRYTISKSTLKRAFLFAEDIWEKQFQSQRDFGSNTMRKRSDFIADTVEGKLAEEGFSMFLYDHYNINLNVDYDVYIGNNQNDFGNDVQSISINDNPRLGLFKIDIKSARHYSKWLLVEKHKFWANMYILVTVEGLDMKWEKDPYSSSKNRIIVDIVGFAFYTDLIDQNTKRPWFIFKEGDPLINPKDALNIIQRISKQGVITPNKLRRHLRRSIDNGKIQPMNVKLKAPVNYGIPKQWLRKSEKDWDQVINIIEKNSIKPEDSIVFHKVGI